MPGDAAPGEAADLPKLVRELLPRSAHVQLANPPGRNEPGVGLVDFAPLLSVLEESGYDGYVGCEYKPSTEVAEDSFGWCMSQATLAIAGTTARIRLQHVVRRTARAV